MTNINMISIVKNIATKYKIKLTKQKQIKSNQDIDCFILKSSKDLINLLTQLKQNKDIRLTILTDLFAADFPSKEKRFEIVYSLLSLKLNYRIIFKLHIDEGEKIHSISKIFNASIWYEREIFDMFGVEFIDLPDHRRILTDYGFVGHPLKKDFPLTGHLQIKYDNNLQQIIHEPVKLAQEYRDFDFTSPWQGSEKSISDIQNILPGDEKASK